MKTEFTLRCLNGRGNGLGRWVGGFCALMVVVSSAASLIAAALPDSIFYENFEEATLGGTYDFTPPSTRTDTTGISASIGTFGRFINDDGVIVSGLDGSAKALNGLDNHAGTNLRLVLTPTRNPNAGHLQLALDFKATGPLSGSGPLQLLMQSPAGGSFLGALLFSDLHFLITDSTTSLFGGGFSSSSLATSTEYRLNLDANIDTYKYDFSVTRLSDQAVLINQTGLNFINSAALRATGFSTLDIQFGFADFGGAPAALTLDNINLAAPVPEPAVVGLMILGGALLFRRRSSIPAATSSGPSGYGGQGRKRRA